MQGPHGSLRVLTGLKSSYLKSKGFTSLSLTFTYGQGFYSLGLTFGVHGFTIRGLAPNFPTSSYSSIFFIVLQSVVVHPRVVTSKRLTSGVLS